LTPERALRLFGDGALSLEKALQDAEVGVTEKYIWLGNLVAPSVAAGIASSVKKLIANANHHSEAALEVAETSVHS
jgi:hypothetical protein